MKPDRPSHFVSRRQREPEPKRPERDTPQAAVVGQRQRIACGVSGSGRQPDLVSWSDLPLTRPWLAVIDVLTSGNPPRPLQVKAVGEARILATRRNLLVAAPTNSGKSLVGLLVLLDAARVGRRVVLLEPLRALANEKLEELRTQLPLVSPLLGRNFSVRISTGDYRLEDETMGAPPPGEGELLVATPERFEAILRNPENEEWVASIAAVCLDEAHLISDSHRGATLEYLITSLLCLPAPPRLVLLSASLGGDLTRATEWLHPCDVVQLHERFPPLEKDVCRVTGNDDANAAVIELVREALQDPAASVLVFVYQTSWTTKLAERMTQALGALAGPAGARAYHAKMRASERERVRGLYARGESRCVVATTALALGVNLPATHVVVRDVTFHGSGRLEAHQLLQMIGRAGRGNRPGHGTIVVRPNDSWDVECLVRAIREEHLPPLTSRFDTVYERAGRGGEDRQRSVALASQQVLVHLARQGERGQTATEVRDFFQRSLGGRCLSTLVPQTLSWLSDSERVLAHQEESGSWKPTSLGMAAVRGVLPPATAAGVGQLLRDLLSLDADDRLLGAWRPLDHLIVLELLAEHSPTLRPFSAALAEHVDAWMEGHPSDVPVLYREWICGAAGSSKADEVLGSLGVACGKFGSNRDEARKKAYLAVFRAMVLLERGRGQTIEELVPRWGIEPLDGQEERWRDERLWLLSGLVRILETRCFYYHLREECQATDERVRRVEHALRVMRRQVFELREILKHCSPLGSLVVSLRRTAQPGDAGIGAETVRRLEEGGIRRPADLVGRSSEEIVRLGVQPRQARRIVSYIARRMA